MKRNDLYWDDPETISRPGYKVTVEIVVEAADHGEAEEKVNEFIKDAILAQDSEDREMRYVYDITDVETAEIDFS